jgi:hypothetical protein
MDRRLLLFWTMLLATAAGALSFACTTTTTPPEVPAAEAIDAATEAAPVDAGTPPLVDAGTCELPGSFGSSKCNACVASNCCAPLATCAADPDCRKLRDCILSCLDVPDASGCGDDCRSRHADDAGRWYDVETCWGFSKPCAFECATTQ